LILLRCLLLDPCICGRWPQHSMKRLDLPLHGIWKAEWG
jgi:hypothetical protein